MDKLLQLENISDTPILRTWNESLITDEADKAKLAEYKQSEDYLGRDDQERQANKKVPNAILLEPFFQELGKGVMSYTYKPTKNGNYVSRVRTPELKWALGVNPEKLKGKDIYRIREVAMQFNVSYSENDNEDSIIQRIVDKYGDYKVVMTEEAYNTSGLNKLAYREIQQKLKPGESKPRVITTGLIKVTTYTKAPENFTAEEDFPVKQEPTIKGNEPTESEFIKHIENMDYEQLQEMGKSFGLKANEKKEVLRENIIKHVQGK